MSHHLHDKWTCKKNFDVSQLATRAPDNVKVYKLTDIRRLKFSTASFKVQMKMSAIPSFLLWYCNDAPLVCVVKKRRVGMWSAHDYITSGKLNIFFCGLCAHSRRSIFAMRRCYIRLLCVQLALQVNRIELNPRLALSSISLAEATLTDWAICTLAGVGECWRTWRRHFLHFHNK